MSPHFVKKLLNLRLEQTHNYVLKNASEELEIVTESVRWRVPECLDWMISKRSSVIGREGSRKVGW